MTEAKIVCEKCGGERIPNPSGRGYICPPCERKRKRAVAKRLAARRAAEKPPEPEPIDRSEERDSAVILSRHKENLALLRAELAEVTRLRQTGATLASELESQQQSLDQIAEALLAGQGSDEELGKANLRRASLSAQLEHLSKRQHKAELSLQKRLTPDIRAQARLESFWRGHLLERETAKFSELLLENRRESLLDQCQQLAEASVSYSAALTSLGDAALESFAWSRPLDAPKSERIEWATQHIPDPLYAQPNREEIVRFLLEAAAKAIKHWDALLKAVGEGIPAIILPSYEEPPAEAILVPPDTGLAMHPYWTSDDLATIPFPEEHLPEPDQQALIGRRKALAASAAPQEAA
jgi:hypothetical protein